MEIRTFRRSDTADVVTLWHRCNLVVGHNDPHEDIERKITDSPWGLIVATVDNAIVGTVMVGYDGHRGWINYLGCDPDYRRKGIASALMAEARSLLLDRGCPKINLQVRNGNGAAMAFYSELGYCPDDVSSLGLRLEATA